MDAIENPYAHLLGIQVVDVGNGEARVRAQVKAEHTNHLGYTHGGFLYSVADFAFELASNSHGMDAVGLTTTMEFYRPSTVGVILEAIATETHLGKTIATYHIKIHHKEKLIASFTGTVYRKTKD